MSIPKVIHYCWFGGNKKSEKVINYINTWKRLEGYKIIEWNEKNFDLNSCSYIKEAYKAKKWAFVSDYVRLKVLQEYGGIYLDTDVEVKKSFDDILDSSMFIGFIYDCSIGTAVIGAQKNHEIISQLVKLYEKAEFLYENNIIKSKFEGYENFITNNNNDLFTAFFIKNVKGFKLQNKIQKLDNITIYPKEYFERKTNNRDIDYTVHHCYGSWYKEEPNKRSKLAVIINSILGDIYYDKLQCYLKLKKLPYYNLYLEDQKGDINES